jgi:glycosyltransferase involved in cell wall biosynthesis
MFISVILSTYNQPEWLVKVLYGYACQSHRDFEVVIADDGSGPETRRRIDEFRARSGLRIKHVWQEDDGFQKTRILNKAVLQADADYLLFSDGDCVPRGDFLATHARLARPGHYLSGGYFKLPMSVSRAITERDIEQGRAFDAKWLLAHGERLSRVKLLKLTARGRVADLLNRLTRTNPTWNGHNASGWKADILAVNGFDERMQYGGEDWEMGLRLVNLGIRPRQIRFSAICVHLDHPRGYENAESHAKNEAIGIDTMRTRSTWTPYGIRKDATPQ